MATAVAIILMCTPRLATGAGDRGPLAVRFTEGSVHGFLDLHGESGALLAHGELTQSSASGGIDSRMTFRFRDGSMFEETVLFTQHGSFAMQQYHLVQKGPAFEHDLDATLARTGQYTVTSVSHSDGKRSEDSGHLDLPGDVANGLVVLVAKNLRVGDSGLVHMVAFTPAPQLIGLRLAPAGADAITIGDRAEQANRLVVSPQVGGVKGVFARLLGKLPPDSHVWILADRVPAFVRFEGPMYQGPVWRMTLAAPHWPEPPATASRVPGK